MARGATVLTDRFADSSRVYQGLVRADLRNLVEELHRLTIGIDPDRTILIDIDPDVALARGQARGGVEDRFENLGLDFQQRLRQGFLTLAGEVPDRFRIVDGRGSEDEIAARVRAALS